MADLWSNSVELGTIHALRAVARKRSGGGRRRVTLLDAVSRIRQLHRLRWPLALISVLVNVTIKLK